MKPIGTIKEELAACRAAIAEYPDAKWFWCLHHEQLCEEATEPIENRIRYILKEKPEHEQATRFRNLRPVKDAASLIKAWAEYERVKAPALAEYERVTAQAWAEVAKQLAAEWPDNTWQGKSIFAEAVNG